MIFADPVSPPARSTAITSAPTLFCHERSTVPKPPLIAVSRATPTRSPSNHVPPSILLPFDMRDALAGMAHRNRTAPVIDRREVDDRYVHELDDDPSCP